jgi:hypothetical protein
MHSFKISSIYWARRNVLVAACWLAGRRLPRRRTFGVYSRLGGSTSNETGGLAEKVRAIADFNSKLELLNRGQRWIIRKIVENLPSISDEPLV